MRIAKTHVTLHYNAAQSLLGNDIFNLIEENNGMVHSLIGI